MQQTLKYWLPVVLWAAVILYLGSSDAFSSESTQSTIREVVGAAPAQNLRRIDFTVRKFAHLVEYSILTVLAFRAVRKERNAFSLRWAAKALGVTAAVASTDELLQSFLPFRSAELRDVALDCLAGVLTLILIWVASRRSSERVSRQS
jgi:VanZ family protein